MSDMSSGARKLEPFLLMIKSAKGAGAAKLIENAASAPGVFVFAELLEHPNVKELTSNPQYAPHVEMLRLFSYGTYSDYKAHQESYPQLNAAQLTKLKYLSLVTLGSERRILPYADLKNYLEISTTRELEDLIIDGMYQDVLRGRLDQKEQQLELEYTMGRDLRPGQLEALLASLRSWSDQTAQAMASLETHISAISSSHSQRATADAEYNTLRADILAEIAAQRKLAKRAATGGQGGIMMLDRGDDEMEVDAVLDMQPPSHSGGGGLLSSLIGGRRKPASHNSGGGGGSGGGSGAGGGPNTRKRNRP